MNGKRLALLVIGLFILLYILPLGIRPLLAPDEFRYAEIPREMLAAKNWVVPHLDGFRYFEKPVMGYWINATSMYLFGENAFALRLPTALSAGISALVIFMLVQMFGQGYLAGIFSSIVFLTCAEVFGIGTFAVLDGMLSMFLTVAMGLFFLAYMEEKKYKKQILFSLFGVFCGFAFLTKGFLALAIPLFIIIPFMLWEKRGREIFKTSLIPILAIVLTALPWALMIHAQEGDFWNYFFWTEHIKRFTSESAQHIEPFWFFIPVILVGALPWSGILPAIITGLRKTEFKTPLIRFATCWFTFPFIFFSISRGKLATYILPCFAPLAIILTIGLLKYFQLNKEKEYKPGVVTLATIMGLAAVTLIINQTTGFAGIKVFGPEETWKWIFAVAALLSWGLLSLLSIKIKNATNKFAVYAAVPLLLMLSFHFVVPDLLINKTAPENFLLEQLPQIKPTAIIVTDNFMLHPVCWTYKRNDIYLLQDTGEVTYGVNYDENSLKRFLDFDQFNRFVKSKSRNDIILITKAKFYKRNQEFLPKPTTENNLTGFVFAVFSKQPTL